MVIQYHILGPASCGHRVLAMSSNCSTAFFVATTKGSSHDDIPRDSELRVLKSEIYTSVYIFLPYSYTGHAPLQGTSFKELKPIVSFKIIYSYPVVPE